MIQQLALVESDFRGELFGDHHQDLKGNNDVLNLSQPEAIQKIHMTYLRAGASIIGTNTFNATRIAQADYGLEGHVYAINESAARIAKASVEAFAQESERECYVAGAMGPTNKTASLSKDVNRPGDRDITFDELRRSYCEQARSLMSGGVDLLLVETVFDTLNLKACYVGIEDCFAEMERRLPIMISVTITDQSGRTLSGQTIGAFWNSVAHCKPLSVGINCALGAGDMRPFLKELSEVADCFVSCYPNAGLPNPLSDTGYDETPEDTSSLLYEFGKDGLLNLVGGCCGTTPEHIAAIAKRFESAVPRKVPSKSKKTFLSGLEPYVIDGNASPRQLIMVGERTNVTGSPRFRKLVKEGKLDEALNIATQQVQNGANIIDVNFDEGLLDSEACMTQFLNLIASEPDISRVPIMIDSSKWSVLEAGLKCIQGKGVVNSISLKEGETQFIENAELCKKYGAAMIVMAFDEQGQAATQADKVRICARAYDILVNQVGVEPEDIIFDPNILTVATGMEEHNNYAVDFIEAVREIKASCPGALTSGGVSNISFSFHRRNHINTPMICVLFIGLFLLHKRLKVGHRTFHNTRTFNHLGQKHLSIAKEFAHHLHAFHQRTFDHFKRLLQLSSSLLRVVLDVI